jgi:CheY-like chemotaxis protein
MNSQAKAPCILVVNNSLHLLNLFHGILEGESEYDIEISNYAFESIDSVARLNPKLIILDFERAGQKEEWQLLQLLKLHDATTTIPILLCVIAVQEFREQEAHFTKQGIQLLYKPFNREELLASVHLLLK